VSAHFEPSDDPPLDMLCAWIDESYRAIAPKKAVKTLASAVSAPTRRRGRGA